MYLAAVAGGQLLFNDGSKWVKYASGPFPTFYSGLLYDNRFVAVDNYPAADIKALAGVQIIAGVGLDDDDLIKSANYSTLTTLK